MRSQKWSERGKVATISPEFLGWVFWCEGLVVTFFRKQVNNFQRADVFYTSFPYLGSKLQFCLFHWTLGWLLGITGDSWFSSSDVVAEVGDQVAHSFLSFPHTVSFIPGEPLPFCSPTRGASTQALLLKPSSCAAQCALPLLPPVPVLVLVIVKEETHFHFHYLQHSLNTT